MDLHVVDRQYFINLPPHHNIETCKVFEYALWRYRSLSKREIYRPSI